ncbi:MAG: hypothetical protein IJ109_10405 [Firmicutes bacterium]|nr:hypothetical protein [Bacillota bacterium]MBQ9016507.1 hypothetical protein [Bacillota bacterium]
MNMPFNWKEIKKIRNKRTGRTRYICGCILSAIGLVRVMDFVEFPYPWHADSLIVGGILLLLGIAVLILTWRRVDKWNRYEAFINIERKLTEKDDLSTEVDIQTLQTMFAQDGLVQTMGRQ